MFDQFRIHVRSKMAEVLLSKPVLKAIPFPKWTPKDTLTPLGEHFGRSKLLATHCWDAKNYQLPTFGALKTASGGQQAAMHGMWDCFHQSGVGGMAEAS